MALNCSSNESKLFVEKPLDGYLCPLCFNVLKDLKSCPNGHCFCETCISDALDCRSECPICKVKVTKDRLSRNLFLENVIRELKMICISCEDDESTGEARCSCSSSSHLENDCGFYKLKCPNAFCSVLVQRQNLFEHLASSCSARYAQCDDCQLHLLAGDMDEHKLRCSNRLVDCPNQCGLRSTFAQTTTHCDVDCPLQIIKCPLFELGLCHERCKGTLLRLNVTQHTAMQVEQIKEDKREVKALRAKNQGMIVEIGVLNHERFLRKTESTAQVVELTDKIQALECQVKELQDSVDVTVNQNPDADTSQCRTSLDFYSAVNASISLESRDNKNSGSSKQSGGVVMKYLTVNWTYVVFEFAKQLRMLLPVGGEITLHCSKSTTGNSDVVTELSLLDCVFEAAEQTLQGKAYINVIEELIEFARARPEGMLLSEPTAAHLRKEDTIIIPLSDRLEVLVCLSHIPAGWTNYSSLHTHLTAMALNDHDLLCVENMSQAILQMNKEDLQTLAFRMMESFGIYFESQFRTLDKEPVIRKKYVTVSWQQVLQSMINLLEPHFETSDLFCAYSDTQRKKLAHSVMPFRALWDVLLMIHGRSSPASGSFHLTVMSELLAYFGRLHRDLEFTTEPSEAHRRNAVVRVVSPGNLCEVTIVICVDEMLPEWQSFANLNEHLNVTIPHTNELPLLPTFILDCIERMVQLAVTGVYQRIAETFVASVSSLPSAITTTDSTQKALLLDRADYQLGACIGRHVEYRNKKMKWIPGVLMSVDVAINSCVVVNRVNETVFVKLSTSVRMADVQHEALKTHEEWFASLKTGDRVECKHRVSDIWSVVTVVELTHNACVVENAEGKIERVMKKELREVL